MNPKLTQIQAKIREVCPETRHECSSLGCYQDEHATWDDLGLVHVLRAIGGLRGVSIWLGDSGKTLAFETETTLAYWNLTKSLHEQSDEVISFLHELLCQ